MWQQNCVLRKFGLLKSCQPITSHRPTDRQNTVLISLAYRSRLRLVPSDLTNLFFTCFSVRKPQPASRLGLSGWPNMCTNPTHKPLYLITNINCVLEIWFAAILFNFSQCMVKCFTFKSDKILCKETSIIKINHSFESAHWNNMKNPDIYVQKSEGLCVRS